MNQPRRIGVGRRGIGLGVAVLAGVAIGVSIADRGGPGSRALASAMSVAAPRDAASYAIGFDTARNAAEILRIDGVSFDAESMIQGFTDAIRGNAPAMADVDMEAALAQLEREVSTRFAKERLGSDPVFRALAEHNQKQSTEMLQRMAAREGAKSIDGGVWYVELQPGEGRSPAASDIVTVTFTVRTADGSVVTEGVKKEFRISGMIEGGQRALTRMRPGARWLIGIPSELAFGIGGMPPEIGPNQAVLVDCTLVSIE